MNGEQWDHSIATAATGWLWNAFIFKKLNIFSFIIMCNFIVCRAYCDKWMKRSKSRQYKKYTHTHSDTFTQLFSPSWASVTQKVNEVLMPVDCGVICRELELLQITHNFVERIDFNFNVTATHEFLFLFQFYYCGGRARDEWRINVAWSQWECSHIIRKRWGMGFFQFKYSRGFPRLEMGGHVCYVLCTKYHNFLIE